MQGESGLGVWNYFKALKRISNTQKRGVSQLGGDSG
jgi:hypothetical protein